MASGSYLQAQDLAARVSDVQAAVRLALVEREEDRAAIRWLVQEVQVLYRIAGSEARLTCPPSQIPDDVARAIARARS